MAAVGGGTPRLLVARTEHGTTSEKHIHREFFEPAEYRIDWYDLTRWQKIRLGYCLI